MTEKLILFVIIITFVILFIGFNKSSNFATRVRAPRFTKVSKNIPNTFGGYRLRVKGTDLYITWIPKNETNFQIREKQDIPEQLFTYDGFKIRSLSNAPNNFKGTNHYLRWGSNDGNNYYLLLWDGTPQDNKADIWTTDGKHLYNKGYSDKIGSLQRLAVVGNRVRVVGPEITDAKEIIAELPRKQKK